jgi:hypothetical protein
MQRGFDWVRQHQARSHLLSKTLAPRPCFEKLMLLQGNHFNEYAGFECEYGRYPDLQQASHFVRHYLSEADGHEPVRVLNMSLSSAANSRLAVAGHVTSHRC